MAPPRMPGSPALITGATGAAGRAPPRSAWGGLGFVGARKSRRSRCGVELADRIARAHHRRDAAAARRRRALRHREQRAASPTGVLSTRSRPRRVPGVPDPERRGLAALHLGLLRAGEPTAQFLGVVRRSARGSPRAARAHPAGPEPHPPGGAAWPGHEGWTETRAQPSSEFFDPSASAPGTPPRRSRAAGAGACGPIPYLFHGRNEPGVTYASARCVDPASDDSPRRVRASTSRWPPSRSFLSRSLAVAQRGRAYVITRDGTVVGDPEGRLVRESADGWCVLAGARTTPIPMLARAHGGPWAAPRRSVGPPRPSRSLPMRSPRRGPCYGVATPFPADTEIPWLVVTVVPRDDLLGTGGERSPDGPSSTPSWHCSPRWSVGALLSHAVGNSVARLQIKSSSARGTARRVRRDADLTLVHPRAATTWASATSGDEAAACGPSLATCRTSSCARCWPRGSEAKLGAERRELTVLFSDIEKLHHGRRVHPHRQAS